MPPAWTSSALERARAAILVAQGDLRGAQAAYERAIGDGRVLPLDRGRAMLGLGVLCRRLRAYGQARAMLDQALSVFSGIGSPPWIERTRTELRRIPGRRTSDGIVLTDAEARIAELVAAGRSNKDVAAELFLSVKTIEWHRTNLMKKLDVHNVADLVRYALQHGLVENAGAPGLYLG